MTPSRCFVCGARAFERTDRTLVFPDAFPGAGRARAFAFACASCGLLLPEDADLDACDADLARRLTGPHFACDEAMGYGLDLYTLRIGATRGRRWIEPFDEAQREALDAPHGRLAAAARLFDLDSATPVPVTLGLLCRPAEIEDVTARLAAHAGWAREVIVLLDAAPAAPSPVRVAGFADGTVRIAARPLAGDFAAQRNALAGLGEAAWMLQLDADEDLEPGTGMLLGALAAEAGRHGLVSVGLARRNLVDGVLSDVFPDTQYRLNHRSVPYAGRVHERPARDWRHSTIALHGAIVHRLARAHVEIRSARYEALDPGRGRLGETARLLRPYRA